MKRHEGSKKTEALHDAKLRPEEHLGAASLLQSAWHAFSGSSFNFEASFERFFGGFLWRVPVEGVLKGSFQSSF